MPQRNTRHPGASDSRDRRDKRTQPLAYCLKYSAIDLTEREGQRASTSDGSSEHLAGSIQNYAATT